MTLLDQKSFCCTSRYNVRDKTISVLKNDSTSEDIIIHVGNDSIIFDGRITISGQNPDMFNSLKKHQTASLLHISRANLNSC